ncbi:MAG: hypothetical protein M3137_17950 [Actinomycetota bacterium]|nr:hypothetical protein [Actinomycetota bacterium]
MHVPGEAARRRADCVVSSEWLPALAAGDVEPCPRIERHVTTCLRCQADLARYRRLRRTLRGWSEVGVEPGPEVLPAILASLERAGTRRRSVPAVTGRRTVYAGGMAVATAGAAAGVIVWVSRHRPSLAG